LAGTAVTYLLIPSGAAGATLNFEQLGKAGIVTIDGLRSGTYYAGELLWTWQDGQPADLADWIYTYCVDIAHNVTAEQTVEILSTDALSPPGEPEDQLAAFAVDAGKKAAWLYNTYAPTIHESGTNVEAAALQVAIWEALYDEAPDLGAGDFQLVVNAGVYGGLGAAEAIRDQAWTYLAGEEGLFDSGSYHTSEAVWLNAPIPNGQDQIVSRQPVSVPEPSTTLLLALVLALAPIGRGIIPANKAGL
jgi:hypothetical protein